VNSGKEAEKLNGVALRLPTGKAPWTQTRKTKGTAPAAFSLSQNSLYETQARNGLVVNSGKEVRKMRSKNSVVIDFWAQKWTLRAVAHCHEGS